MSPYHLFWIVPLAFCFGFVVCAVFCAGDHLGGKQETKGLKREIMQLRNVCGEAYQLAGAINAPERALDNLLSASEGRPLPHKSFLPLTMDDFNPLVQL